MGSWWLREEWLLLLAALVRVLLVAFGDWQDAHLEVRYTDIDYHVFSDAAALLARGRSPFDRETYRYSPLLALLLVPNTLFHPCWGKLLFSAADLLAGHMIHKILGLQGFHGKTRQLCTALWLFNPFTFTIGTRGNCEALVCCMILRIIYCLHKGCAVEAAIWYGMSSHVEDAYFLRKAQIKCHKLLVELFYQNKTRILFGAVSGGVFFLLTGVSYYFYRDQFLHEALFYHLTRTDPRHNFSIYFYHIYLHHSHSFSLVERLVSFVPQFLVQTVLTTYFAKDVSFCFFIQTVAFVAFNKVITAQYFVWFFCLVPLILPRTNLTSRQSLLCVLLWTAAQLHWLLWAYALEFEGYNVFFQLWLASLIFFAANVSVLSIIIWHHTSEPVTFKGSVFMHEEVKENKSH
ncbi:hypothetical protein L7F22_006764 [Adiantum nelumboides]|nr:hypothetical protein [Adiantum nelumboides]